MGLAISPKNPLSRQEWETLASYLRQIPYLGPFSVLSDPLVHPPEVSALLIPALVLDPVVFLLWLLPHLPVDGQNLFFIFLLHITFVVKKLY